MKFNGDKGREGRKQREKKSSRVLCVVHIRESERKTKELMCGEGRTGKKRRGGTGSFVPIP